jgi:hypothetical protein
MAGKFDTAYYLNLRVRYGSFDWTTVTSIFFRFTVQSKILCLVQRIEILEQSLDILQRQRKEEYCELFSILYYSINVGLEIHQKDDWTILQRGQKVCGII